MPGLRYQTRSNKEFASTVAGGNLNRTPGNFATVPGGRECEAPSRFSYAAGYQARARHDGTFVWADSLDDDFASIRTNEFAIRAEGGVRLSDDTPKLSFGSTKRQMLDLFDTGYGMGVQSGTLYRRSDSQFAWFQGGVHSDDRSNPGFAGTVLTTLSSSGLKVNGTVDSSSGRNAKEDFQSVDSAEVLDKVLALPLQEWRYNKDPQASRHLGPMAQDFHAPFDLGADEKHIATVDADGVSIAAIQGLNQKLMQSLEQKESRITQLEARLEKLEELLLSKE